MQDCKLMSILFSAHSRLSSVLSPKTKKEKKHMLNVSYISAMRALYICYGMHLFKHFTYYKCGRHVNEKS